MTVLSALQSAALRLNGTRPSTIFSATDTFEMELADLANEVAQDIAKSHDWQVLTKVATFTGDGTTTDFAPPTDYDRMLIKSDLIDTASFAWGYSRIRDVNEWLLLTQEGFEATPGSWILFGGLFQFVPAPAAASTTKFPYISKNIVTPSQGTDETQFIRDGDTFKLSERLLTLGVIWRWREQKKLDVTGEQAAFEKAFAEISGRDKGSRILFTGPARFPASVSNAYPGTLGA